jgi:hypothetical protein
MDARHPTQRLTQEEMEQVRCLVTERGMAEASGILGLNRATIHKATAGFPVARLTVIVIRLRLATLTDAAT